MGGEAEVSAEQEGVAGCGSETGERRAAQVENDHEQV